MCNWENWDNEIVDYEVYKTPITTETHPINKLLSVIVRILFGVVMCTPLWVFIYPNPQDFNLWISMLITGGVFIFFWLLEFIWEVLK